MPKERVHVLLTVVAVAVVLSILFGNFNAVFQGVHFVVVLVVVLPLVYLVTVVVKETVA